MSEQVSALEQAAADILTSALETVGAAKEFVLAELPDVVQQLLLWKMVDSAISFVIGAFILLIPVVLWLISRRGRWFDEGNDPTLHGGFGIAACVCAAFCPLFASAFLNLIWLQILIAPKVYLIEYASKLIP